MNALTCGRVPSRALSHKSTYTLNLCSVFHYLALMYKSDPPQSCYYISIFANIWYLIKLIHSIIIILPVFMFYKQRVLANFWGRKDSAICASRKRSGHYFPIWHLCTSRTHLNVAIISLFLTNIWYLIKLIHSIIIILRVFMFYKQRVLANVWGRKDSATCASRKRSGACYCAEHMKWAMNSLFMPTALSFRPQKSAKTRCI